MTSLLLSTPVKSIVTSSDETIITVDQTETISNVLKILKTANISSVPVLNHETNQCIGSVDTLDLMTYVLRASRSHGGDAWVSEVKSRFTHPVLKAIDSSRINPFYPVVEDISVGEAISQFFAFGIHRLPIISRENLSLALDSSQVIISSILSQSDVIRFLLDVMNLKKNDELVDVGAKPVDHFDLVPGLVVSIKAENRLLTAFEVIIANNVNGIAVVDEKGELKGNLSASDFKGFTEKNFYDLDAPLEKVIAGQKPVTCRRDTTLHDVLRLYMNYRIHRVYIVDEHNRPIGIVSMTDVMKIISAKFLDPWKVATK